jgi:7-carboxy-7-deazaguanine synthase
VPYIVKEIFLTLQGEGVHTGRAAVFCRFAGCNLWSGREKDRDRAVCTFCDTDFVGIDGTRGGNYPDAISLARALSAEWQGDDAFRFCVLTGGEPLLQVDDALVAALHEQGFYIAVETNGTQVAPAGIDWLCVSPKADAEIKCMQGEELKLVYPQSKAMPEQFAHLAFKHFLLQPMDGVHVAAYTQQAIEYCLRNPQWRLGTQVHKRIGIR